MQGLQDLQVDCIHQKHNAERGLSFVHIPGQITLASVAWLNGIGLIIFLPARSLQSVTVRDDNWAARQTKRGV
jgi:hypothetical protein